MKGVGCCMMCGFYEFCDNVLELPPGTDSDDLGALDA
jgi:hypothetical protein